jgi:hypothetical protein
MDMNGDYSWEPEEEAEDEYVEKAKPVLTQFFDEHPVEVFYLKQLQVLFEKPFFHWVTSRGLYGLVDEGAIGTELVRSPQGTPVRVFFRRGHRFRRRQIAALVGLIDDMSEPEVAEACGEHADVLFFNALMHRRFVAAGEDVREYGGKTWEKTGHDLDFIVERDGVAYGCEVKNRWDYIEREELEVKVEVCEFLGVRPLFIMRASPKTYNKEIIDAGGFALVFVAHLYPFGMKGLAKRVAEELGLPADSPRAIPSGTIDRFMKWHEGHV